ncbi:MAG: peroxidase-related enzyme [Bacteroidia bacterium]|nr:peroxidase-related enzyme [Bacteroidia bacterium]
MQKISKIFDNGVVTPELQETFDKIKDALHAPFTPHFFQVWALSPESLDGIWPVMRHILTSGLVGRKLKEMIFVAISSLKQCHYCEAAHHAFSLSIGVTAEQIDDLIQNYKAENADPKEKAAIDFAVKLAKDSNSSTAEDIEHLRSVGYNDSEIMEIIAMSGMAVFYNHLANATKINIDEGFLKKLPQSKRYAVA